MNIKDVDNNNTWRCRKVEWKHLIRGSLRTRKYLLTTLITSGIILLFINIFAADEDYVSSTVENGENVTLQFISMQVSSYVINTNGCQIPDYDPLDPQVVQRFIRKDENITCDESYLPKLVGSNETAVFVNHNSRALYYGNIKFECCWVSILREEDSDEHFVYGETCHDFEESDRVDAEFVSVICWKKRESWFAYIFGRKDVIFRGFFTFVPRKPLVEQRCNDKRSNDTDKLSILIVGLDSVSRQNFHRQMPKTLQALRNIGAVEMLGYNKIAYNTYPNLVAVLTSMSEDEIKGNCCKSPEDHFDECNFIWKNFSDVGYRTVLGEDATEMSMFNFLKPGFKKSPTDYYLRPHYLAVEKVIGNTYKSNAYLCAGSELNFAHLLDYTRKVSTTFANDPYFAFFWQSSLTHDFFDYPRFGDDEYSDFVSYAGKHLLRKTTLIFMSDHGIRWGDFRQTFQGKLEESLPFVFIVLPDWWKAKFPKAYMNLKDNAHALTTPFDLHETLKDFLSTERLEDTVLGNRQKLLSPDMPRGISWFVPVPDRRNCKLAAIPDHYCSCHKIENALLNRTIIQNVAKFLVRELNRKLNNFPLCAELVLNRIVDAKMLLDNSEVKHEMSWVDYIIAVETTPGLGVFEGTVRSHIQGNVNLVGTVSRLTAYGNQSACIDDFTMRLYCYCS